MFSSPDDVEEMEAASCGRVPQQHVGVALLRASAPPTRSSPTAAVVVFLQVDEHCMTIPLRVLVVVARLY
jgi:hypothetical protein